MSTKAGLSSMEAPIRLTWAGRLYLWCVIAAGLAAILDAIYRLYSEPIGYQWFLLAILTLISGSATVRLQSVPATISISETFLFTAVLLFGTSAGTLIVALDGLVMSFWIVRRQAELSRLLFNVAAPALSIWIGATAFYAIAEIPPLVVQPTPIGDLIAPLVVFAIVYFAFNSWLIAIIIAFHKRGSAFRIWRDHFAWLSLNYFGGASVSALFVVVAGNLNLSYPGFVASLLLVVPLILVLYLTFRTSIARTQDANEHLDQLNALYLSTIETLAMAIDAKDQITHGHIRRVQHYAVGLAKAMGLTDDHQIRAIEAASLLHDMGKLAVPEYILNKPGKLTAAEFEKMKTHASVGADILSAVRFPYPVVPIVRHHHENWDGSGYPDGLKSTSIPIGARILSVVDCFDALTSDRPYRPRLSDNDAINVLLERRGSMYDPVVVDMFIKVHADLARHLEARPEPARGLAAIVNSSSAHVPEPLHRGAFEHISASAEETLALYDIARDLTGLTNLADVADIMSKHLKRAVPASLCVFYLYDQQGDGIVASHASGEHADSVSGLRIPQGQRLSGWVAANRRTIINSDPILDLGDLGRTLRPRLRSCLSVPLVDGDALVGVLSLYSAEKSAYSEDHRRIIEAVATQLSRTLRDTVAAEQQRRATLRDQTTGLPNREHLERFLAGTMRMPGSRYSLLLIDFDVLAEAYGPDEQTLAFTMTEASRLIRPILRGADIIFRLSEGSLVVVLTLTGRTDSVGLMARVRETLEDLRKQGTCRTVRISVGAATVPDDGMCLEQLIDTAGAQRVTIAAPAPNKDKRDAVH